jgi:uncharacterized DUF497 family protein
MSGLQRNQPRAAIPVVLREDLSKELSCGIDFIEAQDLWEVRAVVVRSDRGDEVRYARIAMHRDGKLWTAIYAPSN